MAKMLSAETKAALLAVTAENLAQMVADARKAGVVTGSLSVTGKFARDLQEHDRAEIEAQRSQKRELTMAGEYRYSL